jgi:predicted Zn-dependent peptidase
VEWQPLLEQVGRLFADWKDGREPTVELRDPLPKFEHLHKETHQTQIGIAYDSVPIGHRDYYAALGAVNVLSGGMSARLFTEVREKRGLCYAIWASYQMFKDRAGVVCYAGTTTERAQETLEVTLRELERLQEGIEPDEVQRLQAGLKSSLIMQEESTSARAGSIASDWYYLGRVRTLDEIQNAIDKLTPRSILEHVRLFPPGNYTVVTLGPKPLSYNPPKAG